MCSGFETVTYWCHCVLAGLEEGSLAFMEATLALANMLCKAGEADQASTLLLHADGFPAEVEGGGAAEGLPLMMRRAELLLQLGQEVTTHVLCRLLIDYVEEG